MPGNTQPIDGISKEVIIRRVAHEITMRKTESAGANGIQAYNAIAVLGSQKRIPAEWTFAHHSTAREAGPS